MRILWMVVAGVALLGALGWATIRMARLGEDTVRAGKTLHPGERIYLQLRCSQCHGEDRLGTDLAPPLENLDEHWSPNRLARYLVRPDSFIRHDPRLIAQREDYKRVLMPPYPHLPRRERDILIRYLLAPPPAAPDSLATPDPLPAG